MFLLGRFACSSASCLGTRLLVGLLSAGSFTIWLARSPVLVCHAPLLVGWLSAGSGLAGRLAPPSEFYPHPEIEALFAHKGELEVTSDCVAAWAGGSAWGVRTKQDKIIRKNIIIGVYGVK